MGQESYAILIVKKGDLCSMNKPSLGTKFVFFQEADTCSDGGEQELVVEMCDGGSGMFIRISTQGWALDTDDLRKFIGRLKWCVKQCEETK